MHYYNHDIAAQEWAEHLADGGEFRIQPDQCKIFISIFINIPFVEIVDKTFTGPQSRVVNPSRRRKICENSEKMPS